MLRTGRMEADLETDELSPLSAPGRVLGSLIALFARYTAGVRRITFDTASPASPKLVATERAGLSAADGACRIGCGTTQ